MVKRLYRSRDERKIWGVCGGIAKRFGIDPALVRFIAVLTLFFAFIGALIYTMWILFIPLEPEEGKEWWNRRERGDFSERRGK